MECRAIRGNVLILLSTLLLLTALPAAMLAQQSTGAGTQSAPQPDPATAPAPVPSPTIGSQAAPAPSTTLADFAWLAGRWQGAWGPRVAQQVWTAPKAGLMMGTFQLTENDTTLVLELFTLVQQSDGIKLRIRHFTPSLVAWENPGPIVLNLQSADAKAIVFENALDGCTKRAVFTRIDADTYVSAGRKSLRTRAICR